MSMKLAVMDPANRNNEFVAHSTSKRTRLGKCEVVRITWSPAAYKTRLPGYKPPVLLIAKPNDLAQCPDIGIAGSFLGRSRDVSARGSLSRIGRDRNLSRD
jgi:hypothetical protein